MALPRGKMTDILLKTQSAFGTLATGNYHRTFAYSFDLGEKFGLPDDPILGLPRSNDRDMTAPAPDLRRHEGRLSVPLDLNHLAYWLIGLFGAPDSDPQAATGGIVFSGQPAAGSTITINGVVFTFTDTAPGANEIGIQGSLATTLSEIVSVLNASVDAEVAEATYDEVDGTSLTIEHDTAGPNGNAFTLAAAAGSNGAVSAATLQGGCHAHIFTSGGETLPPYSIETRLRSAAGGGPRFLRHIGILINAMTLKMNFAQGYHRADLEVVGRHEETHTATSQGGTPTALGLRQVPATRGVLRIAGVAQVPILAVDAAYRNNLQPLEYVADAPYVSGHEPGDSAFSGTLRTRFADETYYDYGRSSEPLAAAMEWALDPGHGLFLSAPRLRFEKASLPFEGPGGIELTLPFRAEQDENAAMLTATLRNEVESYA